jgi:hypothetical protein
VLGATYVIRPPKEFMQLPRFAALYVAIIRVLASGEEASQEGPGIGQVALP